MISMNKEGTDVVPESLRKILTEISDEFGRSPRLPIEFIHGGNGLNFTFEDEEPLKKNRQRQTHVSLIAGRRLTAEGECQILVRNSYRTNCRPRTGIGSHRSTGRVCEGETDSTWFSESHLTRFVGGIRITEPMHPAASHLLASDQKKK